MIPKIKYAVVVNLANNNFYLLNDKKERNIYDFLNLDLKN
jgi:hypothetical protein